MRPRDPRTAVAAGVVTLTCPGCGQRASGAAGPTDEATRLRLWWEGHRCQGRQLELFERLEGAPMA